LEAQVEETENEAFEKESEVEETKSLDVLPSSAEEVDEEELQKQIARDTIASGGFRQLKSVDPPFFKKAPTQTYYSQMSLLEPSDFEYHVENFDKCFDMQTQNLDHEFTIDGSNRQSRIHTCFLNCKDYIYDDFKQIYALDTRPNCTDLAEADERFLICLYPEDKCE